MHERDITISRVARIREDRAPRLGVGTTRDFLFQGKEVAMGKRKVMRLLDPSTGLMECKICGSRHMANRVGGGKYYRGSWQCQNGCKLEDLPLKLSET